MPKIQNCVLLDPYVRGKTTQKQSFQPENTSNTSDWRVRTNLNGTAQKPWGPPLPCGCNLVIILDWSGNPGMVRIGKWCESWRVECSSVELLVKSPPLVAEIPKRWCGQTPLTVAKGSPREQAKLICVYNSHKKSDHLVQQHCRWMMTMRCASTWRSSRKKSTLTLEQDREFFMFTVRFGSAGAAQWNFQGMKYQKIWAFSLLRFFFESEQKISSSRSVELFHSD